MSEAAMRAVAWWGRAGFAAAMICLGTVAGHAAATGDPPPAATAPADAEAAADEAIRTSLRQAAADTVAAFNAADVERLAGMFLADCELVDEAGNLFEGRAAVKELFRGLFERFPGATLEMEVGSVRTLGDDVVVEEGMRRVTTPGGDAAQVAYSAVRSREGDVWPIVSYREFAADPPPTPRDMLAPLEWLVGEWVDESPEGRTTIRYAWSEDGNFLVGEYRLTVEGRPAGTTTQRIGWDPVDGTLRSWTFDPDGGFSEGEWQPTDEGWVIRSEATMPDGATGDATITLRTKDADHFTIESTDRIVGGVPEPDFTLVIARKPPAPAVAAPNEQ